MREKLLTLAGAKPAPGDLILAQAFINTSELDEGTDIIATPEALRSWLVGLGLISPEVAVTESDVRQAIGVREALRTLVLANNSGESADVDAIETLNRAARSGQLVARFEAQSRATLEPLAPGIDGALGRILAVVFEAMENDTWRRLKGCPADRCLWAFFDETKNRSGTWCTMDTCGNRTKARTYRRRHAKVSGPSEARV